MHIAIIGTGLSGLATGWFLLKKPLQSQRTKITFFDPLGIAGGISGMAAGLMHPYSGASAKLNRDGLEGYRATEELLTIASEQMQRSVITGQGLLRLAITPRQKEEFRLSAEKYANIIWHDAEQTVKQIPGLSFHPGIFIEKSLIIDCKLYLEGLWKACEGEGAKLEKVKVNSMDELQDFDQIVLAAGSSVNKLLPYRMQLPVTEVKGQIIEFAWPQDLEPLPFALNSHAYLLMNKEKQNCIAGATYERDFDSAFADVEYATKDILPKVAAMIPALKDASIVSCRAGIRASTPDHMPIIKKIHAKCWVITGMGSKGLLYHALYTKKLVSMLLSDNLTKRQ